MSAYPFSNSPYRYQDNLLSAKRIVIKLGTQVFVQLSRLENHTEEPDKESGKEPLALLAPSPFQALMNQCLQLAGQGKELIIVSSGAVALGKKLLNLTGSLTLSEKQACASAGQSLLMEQYRKAFQLANRVPAQVLLTDRDFSDRQHYLNLRQTLETLLKHQAIPIINENDTTSTTELEDGASAKGFGDNDILSALVASRLDADLLVILTNVNGVYTENPLQNALAKPLSYIEDLSILKSVNTSGQSLAGRGGMSTKLEAARIASLSGVTAYITSGIVDNPLSELFEPESVQSVENTLSKGTIIAAKKALNGKQRWIGIASGYYGVVVLNEGACEVMQANKASLLAVGIVEVYGDFPAGKVISVQSPCGEELGRGVSYFSSKELGRIKGLKSDQYQAALGYDHPPEHIEVIHRDHLVIFETARED